MVYTADDIEKKLAQYSFLKKKCLLLEHELKTPAGVSPEELLSALAVSKSDYDGQHRRDGTYDKMLSLVEKYQARSEHMNQEVVRQILLELHDVQTELERMELYVSLLPDGIKLVVKLFLMEGRSWNELEQMTGVSRRTLVRRKRDGIEKLVGMYNYTGRLHG